MQEGLFCRGPALGNSLKMGGSHGPGQRGGVAAHRPPAPALLAAGRFCLPKCYFCKCNEPPCSKHTLAPQNHAATMSA